MNKISNTVSLCFLMLASQNGIAATAACKNAAAKAANVALSRFVADDCSQDYVQVSKKNENVIYVGLTCDHSGGYQYKITVQQRGSECAIINMHRRAK